MSAVMIGFIGKSVLLTTRFGTDEKGNYVSYSGTSDRYYKVDRKEGLSETALIVIIVVLFIVVFVHIGIAVNYVIDGSLALPFTSIWSDVGYYIIDGWNISNDVIAQPIHSNNLFRCYAVMITFMDQTILRIDCAGKWMELTGADRHF